MKDRGKEDRRGRTFPYNDVPGVTTHKKDLHLGSDLPEFGKQVGGSIEGPSIDVNYMGYAIKP
jgi:hypothetical protein